MKRNEMTDLRAKSIDELTQDIAECRKKLFDGRIGGVVEGKGLGVQGRGLRRHVARCLTIINEKQKSEVKA